MSFVFFFLMHLALTATYDIVGGYMGYVNLGHGAFFGVGAYVYGLTVTARRPARRGSRAGHARRRGLRRPARHPVFRLRGVYFAIATFGILKLLEVLAANLRLGDRRHAGPVHPAHGEHHPDLLLDAGRGDGGGGPERRGSPARGWGWGS